MPFTAPLADRLLQPLQRVDAQLLAMRARLAAAQQPPIDRWRGDAAALAFHLRSPVGSSLPITVLLGGTGTGKSTMVNRVVGAEVTAASFRRTFTTGPVAVVAEGEQIPAGWLSTEQIRPAASDLPARGQAGALVVVASAVPPPCPLVDTPDLDGDQPAHHAQADRAFRWAQRIIFLVTPEKYQMTELLPYYRLAQRYQLPALFVMNKCEEPAVLEDFRRQLAEREWPAARIFAVPRDDAAYDPPAGQNLSALRDTLRTPEAVTAEAGLRHRAADVVGRLNDQVISPMRVARQQANAVRASLAAMETPTAGIDVNPIAVGLQRRLQQRSVLYLIGPQRVLDRVRQVPTLLARLPRATWEWVMRGQLPADLVDPKAPASATDPPDFPALLAEQFTVIRSRIDDLLRSDALGSSALSVDAPGYAAALIPPVEAAKIAEEEIADLKTWLQSRWNATPRDTRMLQALLKFMPGGQRIAKWTEAAPYLLTIILVAHHALFGHVDLMVLGGYSLATWLTERISNEVSSRTRRTNRRISERFTALAHEQIQKVLGWLDSQTASEADLAQLEKFAGDLAAAVENG